MKLKLLICILWLSVFALISCEQTLNDYFIEPEAGFSIAESEVFVYNSIHVINQSEGQQFILFSGEKGSEYDSLSTCGASGIAPNNGNDFVISYVEPGEYKVTLLASGYKSNEKISVTDVMQKTIVVKDTSNSIVGLSFDDMYGIFRWDREGNAAYTNFSVEGKVIGNNISVEMYSPWNTYVWNNKRKPILSPANAEFAPSFELNTNYYSIDIEGVDDFQNGKTLVNFSNGSDLFVPKTVVVESNAGTSREYKLCILQIPQFKSFKINEFTAEVRYDYIDLNKFYVDLAVPSDTDISSMTATFETYQEGTRVWLNNSLQESGLTSNDFSEPVSYSLIYDQPGYEDVFSVHSTVIVSVTKEIIQVH